MSLPRAAALALALALSLALVTVSAASLPAQDVWDRVERGYAENDGVRIHYAALGEGPLVVMIHGFPDFWYTWRHQMAELARDHRVVAVDLRGYNRSDKPEGQSAYAMENLVGDVAAVIRHFDRERAIVVGHDWGGAVAWSFAMALPQMTEKLVVLNLPHPRGLQRELAISPAQQEASQYARDFQQPEAHRALTAEGLASWVEDPAARERYVEAFRRSDFEAMLSYYKENYPREPYTEAPAAAMPEVPGPVLLIHGLDDAALLPDALSGTWEWIDGDLTLVTIPDAGHFVQQDAAELVTRTIRAWLER